MLNQEGAETAERAEPYERDVFIDLLRIVAVLVVVIAHWATTTVIWESGRITIENALSTIRATHWSTWVLQVMPVLFFVGGFANAKSLDRHTGDYLSFLRTRMRRLLTPTLVFTTFWLGVGVGAHLFALPDPNIVERAADLAALPFWFLGLYLVVVALTPPMRWLHDRLGWRVPLALVAGAVVVDLLVHGLGLDAVGVMNYAFVWLLPHQLGFFYAEGRLDWISGRAAGAVAAAGLLGLVLAVSVGGYPVSMVGVPGDERWNTNPPSLALIALTMWLIGLALLARPWLLEWAEARRPLVGRVNRVALSLFLWHVSAAALGAGILYPLGFPRADIGSATWWLWRPVWVVTLIPGLLLLVYGFRRYEIHRAPQPAPELVATWSRYAAAGLAVFLMGFGILGFGVTGFDRVVAASQERLLTLGMNPLQNVIHIGVGLALFRAVYARGALTAATVAAATLYVALGIAGWSTGIDLLGANPAMARLWLVVGAVGLLLAGGAGVADRRRTLRPVPAESAHS